MPKLTTFSVHSFSKKYPLKRAFITGAGGGLGLAFAKALAADKWIVGMTDVDANNLARAAEEVRQAGGMPVPYTFDVSDFGAFKAAVDDFAAVHNGVDIGFNNAGVGWGGFLDEADMDVFKKVVDINLLGPVYGCRLFIPLMKAQGSGHILNVASAAGFVAGPRMSAYNVTKAAVISLSETIRGELHSHNVLVSVLMPTYVRTNIGKNTLGEEKFNLIAQKLVEESKITPEELVAVTFDRMLAGALYIVLPKQAVFLWRYKRLFPDRFWRLINRVVTKRFD